MQHEHALENEKLAYQRHLEAQHNVGPYRTADVRCGCSDALVSPPARRAGGPGTHGPTLRQPSGGAPTRSVCGLPLQPSVPRRIIAVAAPPGDHPPWPRGKKLEGKRRRV